MVKRTKRKELNKTFTPETMSKQNNFIQTVFAFCLTVMFLGSCQSHEPKEDDAFETVKKEKLSPVDTSDDLKDLSPEPLQENVAIKAEITDPWIKFKNEVEKKILNNEKKIKELKGIPNADSKLFRNISGLEKDNNDLRKQLDEYNEEEKVRWETFKTKLNHDADEISIELKDIILNNKK
jgi:hypothetical protein